MASQTASSPVFLSVVPAEVVTSVLTYLHPSELAAFFPCSHLTATFQSSERLWSSLLASIYTLQRPFDASSTWQLPPLPAQTHRALFCHQYSHFPARYSAHFPTIFSLYLRLLAFLRPSAQPILTSLRPGASVADVREMEALAGPSHSLPLDWLIFLKLVDGQKQVQLPNRSSYYSGLFGTVRYYDQVANFRLRPLVAAVREAARASNEGGGPWVVPITYSVAGVLFQTGQMTLEDRMRFCLDQQGRVVRQMGRTAQYHVVASSFTDFLRVYIERLEQGVYGLPSGWEERDSGGISRFAFPDPCGSDCVTRGVRVQASVLFVPEDCRTYRASQQYLFTYRIRISHTSTTAFRGQLTSRYWLITDDTGKQNEVNGPGVIGLYPYVEPGCDVFEYESCCPLATQRGVMRGKFEFQVEGSAEVVDIVVAPFTFDTQRNLT